MPDRGRPSAAVANVAACYWALSPRRLTTSSADIAAVYGGFIDKVPFGSAMNHSLTFRMGQAHVQHYMEPLLGA